MKQGAGLRLLERILEDGPRWIAGICVIISVCFFAYGWGIWDSIGLPTVYWLFIATDNFTLRLALCFLPILLLILMLWIRLLKRKAKEAVYLNIAAVMLLANIIMCAAVPPVVLGQYHHYDRAWMDNHTYYLGSAWNIGVGGAEPSTILIFDCDTIGLFCNILYRQDTGGTPLVELEEHKGRLLADPTTNTLALEINGEVVYTYQP